MSGAVAPIAWDGQGEPTLARRRGTDTVMQCAASNERTVMSKRIQTLGAILAIALAGCAGDKGDTGELGPAGANGTDGVAGPTGPAGQNGQDGQDGTNGTNGQDGQDGMDGQDGPTGPAGPTGAPGGLTANLNAEEVSELFVTIDAISLGASSTVDFTVVDGAGRGAIGLLAGNTGGNLRFAVAKLLPAPSNGDPTSWKSMLNRSRGTAPDQVTQATNERDGVLVDNLDGTYTYTFAADLTAQTDPVTGDPVAYEPTLTHRLVIQLSGSRNGFSLPAVNASMDFVPDGSPVTVTRKIIETNNCNECHGKIVAHGSRYDADYCVVCHNTNTGSLGTTDTIADMSFMIHGIHGGGYRAIRGGPDYIIGGDNFAEVTYPQDLRHCRKCHEQSADAPNGDNWKNVPNRNSCGGCHENATYAAHIATQTNATCALCHGTASTVSLCGPTNDGSCAIEAIHQTVNPTTNNPTIPAGVSTIEYDVSELTVAATGEATILFRVLRDGNSVNVIAPPADLTGGPSFLLAYAMSQDGIDAPADYNNMGSSAAQPPTVSIANLRSGAAGTLTGPDANGYYTAVTSYQFPAGSTMRAVTLQGYFTQTGVPGLGNVARHAIASVKAATGDTARRVIVDSNKCANCHEWFEAHGGNRVFEVQACVMCHNPNLSSSGRTGDPARIDGDTQAELDLIADIETHLAGTGRDPLNPLASGPLDGMNPLTFPEESNNLREMIHGIHASEMRSSDFAFVRIRSNNYYPFNFDEVTFPNDANNCEACHNAGTYDTNLPVGELAGTRIIPSAVPNDRASILAARDTVPNAEDIVSSPSAAACGSCHNNPQALNHMKLNGAYVNGPRSGLIAGNLETCNVCHGAGRTADSGAAHAD